MKKNLFRLLMVSSFAFFIIGGCENPKTPEFAISGSDTLFISITRHLVFHGPRQYRLISQNVENGFDTTYSDSAPPTTTMLKVGSGGNCLNVITPRQIVISIQQDTLYRFVDNLQVQDTFIVYDVFDISDTVYADTVDCRIDTIEAYRSRHKPYFENKDSITAILENVSEGYTQCIQLSAYHFNDDSATITLIDNPSWAKLSFGSVSDCWFYRTKCIDDQLFYNTCLEAIPKTKQGIVDSDCYTPCIVFNADSTALDSSFQWKVVIANKYSQADTLNIHSMVTPYPYSITCPEN